MMKKSICGFVRKIFSFGRLVLTPVRTFVTSVWALLNAVIQSVFKTPTTVLTAFSDYLDKKAEGVDSAMDKRDEMRRTKSRQKKAESSYAELIHVGGCVVDHVTATRTRTALIVGFEAVSFFTTLRGLDQIFGALHPALPLILSLLIQGAIIHLCTHLAQLQKGARFLLGLFLSASIMLSFFGVAEGRIPYVEYVRQQYNNYYDVAINIKIQVQEKTQAHQNVDVLIDTTYAGLQNVLSQAMESCNDEAAEAVNVQIEELRKRTVPVVKQLPDRVRTGPDGAPIVVDGGTEVVLTLDPEAAKMIDAKNTELSNMQLLRKRVESLQQRLDALGKVDDIKQIFKSQNQDPDTILPAFQNADSVLDGLSIDVQQLADDLGLPAPTNLDLSALLHGSRQSNIAKALSLQTADDLISQWKGKPDDLSTEEYLALDESWLEKVVGSVTATAPGRLRDLAVQEVENSYHALASALNGLNMDEAADALDSARENCQLNDPFVYTISALNYNSPNFRSALFALVIAILNDLLALLVGIFMGDGRLNLGNMSSLTPATLRRHMYDGLQSVLLPMAIAQVKERDESPSAVELSRATAKILQDFLDLFEICPELVSSNFCRYRWGNVPAEYGTLANYLSTLNFLRSISPKEVSHLDAGLNAPDESARCMLLSSRAERWLVEIISNSSSLELYEQK